MNVLRRMTSSGIASGMQGVNLRRNIFPCRINYPPLLSPVPFLPKSIEAYRFKYVKEALKPSSNYPKRTHTKLLAILAGIGTVAAMQNSAKAEEKKKSSDKRVTVKLWLRNKAYNDTWGHAALETNKIYMSFRPDFITETWPTYEDDLKNRGRKPDVELDFYTLNAEGINNFCKTIVEAPGLLKSLHDPKSYPLAERVDFMTRQVYVEKGCSFGWLWTKMNLGHIYLTGGQSKRSVEDDSDVLYYMKRNKYFWLYYKALIAGGNIDDLIKLPPVKVREEGILCPDVEALKSELQIFNIFFLRNYLVEAHKREQDKLKTS